MSGAKTLGLSVGVVAFVLIVVLVAARDVTRPVEGGAVPSATGLPAASPTVPAPSPTSAPNVSPSASADAPASASALLERLVVAPEHREGYDRDLFPHWTDEDGDGCNTREEVLITEAVTMPAVSSDCHLVGGLWTSPYDGLVLSGPAEVQIDHFVPLAEAWYSGAWAWSTERRQALANDIGVPWTLVGVSGQSNQSKGSHDPAEWLPPLPSAVCPYVDNWIAVKVRWGLTIDADEKRALVDLVGHCPASPLQVPVVPQ